MEFAFYNAAGERLFFRNDAESGRWTCEEMSLTALFPYDADKLIERGMVIGFADKKGQQRFEIRKVTTYEPDHYQEITAEHICVAELTDRVLQAHDYIDQTLGTVLDAVLSGTGWSVGTGTKTAVSSVKLSNTDVWAAIRNIESAWNVTLFPRITINSEGITGKYLDIKGTSTTGIRIAFNKNAYNTGIIYDDTNVKTAVYGWGAMQTEEGSEEQTVLDFSEVVWSATSAHPAKPSGQKYIEDPAATAAYGRDGQPRFGFYQNSDIDDAELLLEKTWEYLQTVREPRISIECTVADLARMGYVDSALWINELAIVEVEPLGLKYRKKVIKLTIDLIDPTQTQVTIGDYIPNIVYIAEKNNERASGGGGGGGQTNTEYKIKEFETEILANDYQISLRAYQRDMDNVEDILTQAGMSIDAHGVLIYADDEVTNVKSVIDVTASQIRSEVIDQENSIYSYIDQTASQIRSLISHAAEIYVQLDDPTTEAGGGITPEEGTLWIVDGDVHSWADIQGKTWEELSEDYEWRQLMGAQGMVWHNGEWVPFVDHGGALLEGTRIDQNQEHIALQAGKVTGLYGELEVTASQIRSELIDAQSGLGSSITQTASQIRAEVHAANSTLYSVIEQTATQIRSEVTDSVNSLNSSITQTASQIRAEVSASNNSLRSTITQTASQIRSEVSDSVNSLNSSITQTASQIRSEISDSVNSINSSITQTATQIRSEISDSVNSLNSSITQTATQIRSEVSDSVNSLNSSITQTASQIRSEVTDSVNSLNSSITQTASQIRSEVSTADNSLRSEIVQNASQIALKVSNGNVATQLAVECGNVTISGGNLKISGYMTSDQVITNEINSVNNITTSGTLTANDSYLLRLRVSDNGTYRQATWQSQPVVTSISTTSDTRNWAYWDSGAGDYDFLSKKMINSVTENTTTIYYLGRS